MKLPVYIFCIKSLAQRYIFKNYNISPQHLNVTSLLYFLIRPFFFLDFNPNFYIVYVITVMMFMTI